jgi:uncharacterized protein with GYD domain
VTLNTQQCNQWRGIAWQTGEYDVAQTVSAKNDSVRYAARFTLEENASGQFTIQTDRMCYHPNAAVLAPRAAAFER